LRLLGNRVFLPYQIVHPRYDLGWPPNRFLRQGFLTGEWGLRARYLPYYVPVFEPRTNLVWYWELRTTTLVSEIIEYRIPEKVEKMDENQEEEEAKISQRDGGGRRGGRRGGGRSRSRSRRRGSGGRRRGRTRRGGTRRRGRGRRPVFRGRARRPGLRGRRRRRIPRGWGGRWWWWHYYPSTFLVLYPQEIYPQYYDEPPPLRIYHPRYPEGQPPHPYLRQTIVLNRWVLRYPFNTWYVPIIDPGTNGIWYWELDRYLYPQQYN